MNKQHGGHIGSFQRSVVCLVLFGSVFNAVFTLMDPLELQEYVDYLSSDEGKRKWPSRFDNISTAKAKDQAKRSKSIC